MTGPDVRPGARGLAFDAALALGLTALSLMLALPFVQRGPHPLPLVLGLLVLHSGCIVFRRLKPSTTFAVNVASAAVVVVLGYPLVSLGLSVLVAVYSLAASKDRVSSLVAVSVLVMLLIFAHFVLGTDGDVSTLIGNVFVLATAWFLGDVVRSRRSYLHQLEIRTLELERAREELAQVAVAEERLRIARELHDVIGHSMSMIAVQAGVGAHVIGDQPGEAKRSLEIIERTSKTALQDIRRVLGLLRGGDDGDGLAPAPGVDDIPALVDEVRSGGVEVDLRISLEPASLPPALALSAFRIVQEALTNVVRHSGARRARVVLADEGGSVRVEVVDDGRGAKVRPDGGHGIDGMKERAALHGGTLSAEPLAEGGFRVVAMLPHGGGR